MINAKQFLPIIIFSGVTTAELILALWQQMPSQDEHITQTPPRAITDNAVMC